MDKPRGKNGGRRPGAGRPKGSTNALGYGEAKAVHACKLRLPKDATPEAEYLAQRALQRIVDVMEGGVSHLESGSVLKAATRLREEVCGSLTQKVEHSIADQTDEQLQARLDALRAQDAAK